MFSDRRRVAAEEVPLEDRTVYISTPELAQSGISIETEFVCPKKLAHFHEAVMRANQEYPRLENRGLETGSHLHLLLQPLTKGVGRDELAYRLGFTHPYEWGGSGSYGGLVTLEFCLETPRLRKNDLVAEGKCGFYFGNPLIPITALVDNDFISTQLRVHSQRYFRENEDSAPQSEVLDLNWMFDKGRFAGVNYMAYCANPNVEEEDSIEVRKRMAEGFIRERADFLFGEAFAEGRNMQTDPFKFRDIIGKYVELIPADSIFSNKARLLDVGNMSAQEQDTIDQVIGGLVPALINAMEYRH